MSEVFDYPYHTYETENPESSVRIQLGNSYVFTTPPSSPDQRIITLHFPVMKYYTNGLGIADPDINPQLNMLNLTQFYQRHLLWKLFKYNHPIHGILNVRFNKPLHEPEGIVGGDGAVKGFDVTLIEIP